MDHRYQRTRLEWAAKPGKSPATGRPSTVSWCQQEKDQSPSKKTGVSPISEKLKREKQNFLNVNLCKLVLKKGLFKKWWLALLQHWSISENIIFSENRDWASPAAPRTHPFTIPCSVQAACVTSLHPPKSSHSPRTALSPPSSRTAFPSYFGLKWFVRALTSWSTCIL